MTDKRGMNVLFTCVGRRVALVQSFIEAGSQLGVRCRTFGSDASCLSPALFVCEKHFITRRIDDPRYIPGLLELVRKHRIRLIVPTIDTELKVLAENRANFEPLGATVLISSPEVIDICQDKRKTYQFLLENGFGTPGTRSASHVRRKDLTFPVFLKPWDGSASKGNAVVRNREEFRFWSTRVPNCIVQEYLSGQEYTCDVYVDFTMHVRCVVPRKRIEVRAGEVSKGQSVKVPELMRQCEALVTALGAGPGVITIQCFLTTDKEVKFIEINPRFGGGVPLSIQAGANFPLWILQELTGEKPRIRFAGWKSGLWMLRYDQAVWVTGVHPKPHHKVDRKRT